MNYTISKYLPCAFLLAALSSFSSAAESAKTTRGSMARQATPADINRAFELLEREVLAEELAKTQRPDQSASDTPRSADSIKNIYAENQLVAQLTDTLRNTVASNITQLFETRSEAEVVIHMRLAAKGHIISSAVSRSSGYPSFDFAVLQAVEKTERFAELQDLPAELYERYFRELDLLLRTEDLLR